MKMIVGCERSGVVRRAFRELGHDAWSCDTEPSRDHSPHHIQQDLLAVLDQDWDLMICHPPCTYLAGSGLHWNGRTPGRAAKTELALDFVEELLDAPISLICLENPVGCIGTRIQPATQWIQPYQFGEDASKKTGLWLKGLPKLRATGYVPPRIVAGKKRWANQTDSGQNRLGPSATRQEERSQTYQGIATAMADQWGITPVHGGQMLPNRLF